MRSGKQGNKQESRDEFVNEYDMKYAQLKDEKQGVIYERNKESYDKCNQQVEKEQNMNVQMVQQTTHLQKTTRDFNKG